MDHGDDTNTAALVTHRGGCHCGRVRYEVRAPAALRVDECNCSICFKCGYWHLIVSRSRFELVQGAEALTTYTFNTGVAQHTFCSTCGIKSFYIPRSHPERYSVNARCLDPQSIVSIATRPFDGLHWEDHVHELVP